MTTKSQNLKIMENKKNGLDLKTWLLSVRNAFYKSFKAKSQRAIRLNSCESIFIIFASSYVNSSRQNRYKCCNLHDLIHIFLDNGVKTTPKRRILSLVFKLPSFLIYHTHGDFDIADPSIM